MGRHTAVLEKAAPQVELFTPKPTLAAPDTPISGHRAYAELAAKLFGPVSTLLRRIVAFASVSCGEGVTQQFGALRPNWSDRARR